MISRSQGSGTLALGMPVVASAMVAVTGSRATASDEPRRSRNAPSCSVVTDRVVWLTYHRSISVATDHDQRPFGFRLRQHLAGPLRKPLGALDVPDDGVGVRYYPHEASASRRASSLPRSKSSQAKSANSGSEPARRSPLGATTASTTRRWAPGSSPSLRSWSAGMLPSPATTSSRGLSSPSALTSPAYDRDRDGLRWSGPPYALPLQRSAWGTDSAQHDERSVVSSSHLPRAHHRR